MLRLCWRSNLHKKCKFSSVNGRPVADANFVFRAKANWDQETLSGTWNGSRDISEKALSHVIVAQDCGSWLPWTITTTGKDRVQTYEKWRKYKKMYLSNRIFVLEIRYFFDTNHLQSKWLWSLKKTHFISTVLITEYSAYGLLHWSIE